MKLTYWEQLKRPEWQKKRLEVLESAQWKCESCLSSDSMLHVHHKQYIKGRSAWEYDLTNFEALCENCHKESHEAKDLIADILASLPSQMWTSVASLLAGWAEEYTTDEISARAIDVHSELIGRLAYLCGDRKINDVIALQEFMEKNSPDVSIKAVLERVS